MDDLFVTDFEGAGLAGVDEVGRGPLAGDVVAAAVILDPERPIDKTEADAAWAIEVASEAVRAVSDAVV